MDDTTRRIAARLAPFTNWERTRPDDPRFDLDTVRRLLAELGVGSPPLAVQVGGSKGKGTTAAWIEAFLRAAGVRSGCYASPHVSSIRERVRIDGADVPGDELEAAVEHVLDRRPAGASPTFFEILTAAAAVVFDRRAVGAAVWEVGLGGRLDATTAIDVQASVLTGIELEHTAILGDTVEAIAAEKAWILRPGGIGFVHVGGAAVQPVEAHAARVGCALRRLGRDFDYAAEATPSGLRVTVRGLAAGACTFELGEVPPHEAPAIALAAAAVEHLLGDLPADRTLRRVPLPGRFEVLEFDGEPIVLDGAHTAESSRRVAEEVRRRFPGRRVALLFACARGKRWQDVLRPWVDLVDRAIVTALTDTASEDPVTACGWLEAHGVRARAVPDPVSGLAALSQRGELRVVTGSFYLVGAVRDRLLSR